MPENFAKKDLIKTVVAASLPPNEPSSKLINDMYEYVSVTDLAGVSKDVLQGYYGLLSSFYFDGVATATEIALADTDTWIDVNLTVDAGGLFDNRPDAMKEANPIATTGVGTTADPFVFSLEGLTQTAFCNFRASMTFNPDEDGGKLESRLLFNRHSGTTPSSDFEIGEVTSSMESGADIEYASEPLLTFFVGDTIDTNAVGDAGLCRFQIKCDVPGTLNLRALTWYLNK